MTPYFMAEPGNPSSLHTSGRRARRAVEEAREAIAFALGARPSEVVFTGGGTESDNLAIKGVYWARRLSSTGTRLVRGAIRDRWAALDGVNGAFGYPISDEQCGLPGGGCVSTFTGGAVYWSPA